MNPAWQAPPPPPPPPKPRTQVHQLLSHDKYHLFLDLSSPVFKPLTPNNSASALIPVHQGYLDQLATSPPHHTMTIHCAALGKFEKDWAVTLEHGRHVSVGDVLAAVHDALRKQVTHAEWAKVTDEEAYESARAYTRRVRTANYEMNQGLRRVDFLREKYFFGGITRMKNDENGHHFLLHVRAPPARK